VHDKTDRRPIENSLIAYEACWTNGIELCECDIALTKDERIILCHDDNFTRLALDPTNVLCQQKVGDLTYREIISLPLKSGVRPPLLLDVLRSAEAIGGNARMVVEIKPGNVEVGTALARLFARHPDLMARCAVVMSFDAFAMYRFRKELTHVMDHLLLQHQESLLQRQPTATPPIRPKKHNRHRSMDLMLPTSMSIGRSLEDIATETVKLSPKSAHKRIDSTDHFGIGMTLGSYGNLAAAGGGDTAQDSFQFHPFAMKSSFHSVHDGSASNTDLGEFGQFAALAPIPAGIPADVTPIESTSSAPSQTAADIMLYRPKLLLITVAEQPKKECELQVSVKDFTRIDSWLRGGPTVGSLDGVYIQYEPEMLTPEGVKNMQALTSKYDVGLWGGTLQLLCCHAVYTEYL